MIEAEKGLKLIVAALNRLQIPYCIVGSLASSMYGSFRFTNDIDIVVKMDSSHVGDLVQLLKKDFYADEQMIRSALLHGRAFNLIHFESAYKFDLFPLQRDTFQESQMSRRRALDLAKLNLSETVADFASAEDTLLSKLVWFRETESDMQWKDLESIVKGQRGLLDREYLRVWSQYLGVEALLDKLLEVDKA